MILIAKCCKTEDPNPKMLQNVRSYSDNASKPKTLILKCAKPKILIPGCSKTPKPQNPKTPQEREFWYECLFSSSTDFKILKKYIVWFTVVSEMWKRAADSCEYCCRKYYVRNTRLTYFWNCSAASTLLLLQFLGSTFANFGWIFVVCSLWLRRSNLAFDFTGH